MSGLVHVNAVVAQVGQLAVHALEPLAALASLGLAAVYVNVVDVMGVRCADTADNSEVLRGLHRHDVGVLGAAHCLTGNGLRIVWIVEALGLHGDLETLGTVQCIPRIGHVFESK